jgi:uncharacterized MAPEG superfamily protein
MTIALWCILAMSLLPILCAGIAKAGAGDMDNAAPRDWLERQTGWRRRLDWAQRNHNEALPMFAAAVLVAQVAHAPRAWADALAVAFVLVRLAYTAAYALDRPSVRSAIWTLGLVCIVGLFIISA